MNKKITRQLEDIERTEKKMAELQDHLDKTRASLKVDEDEEIIRSFRSMNVTGWDLLAMLDGIQNGTVKFFQEDAPARGNEPRKKTDKGTERKKTPPEEQVPDVAPESEDNNYGDEN
ncbi:MAG: DUF4315 family protein [Lachnospiraceae bacterium]|nr:DUF4315 family protein [Lachnospiraceae bacterium]